MRLTAWTTFSLVAALLSGCAHAPSGSTRAPGAAEPPPVRPAPNVATKAASTKANLAIEKLRLSELFRGTPVVISLLPDGSLRVVVPLHFSFDAGRSTVKPPLAAVLDHVANGQLNEITHIVITAPADPAPARRAALAGERAAALRDHLAGRGIAASRLVVSGTVAGVVRLVVTDAPAP